MPFLIFKGRAYLCRNNMAIPLFQSVLPCKEQKYEEKNSKL
ncbi:hypothetical protein BLGI_4763 [Brevibacillus laterosporus GI-9]|nr:hypothetical protein BLGI_4763 [Brevibacillus laterosporus GI-9]